MKKFLQMLKEARFFIMIGMSILFVAIALTAIINPMESSLLFQKPLSEITVGEASLLLFFILLITGK